MDVRETRGLEHGVTSGKVPTHYLSDGEIYYLWFFIQGAIMDPFVRRQLRNSWGFCQRHTVGWLSVESAFHPDYLHGPSILLSDLIERAHNCLHRYKVPLILATGLKNKRPCFMCALGYNSKSAGYAREDIVELGSDVGHLVRFAVETKPYWQKYICPRCVPNTGGVLCRSHLIQELSHSRLSSIPHQQQFTDYILEQLALLGRSFQWEFRGSETTECQASLISAAGWLNGWTELMNFVDKRK